MRVIPVHPGELDKPVRELIEAAGASPAVVRILVASEAERAVWRKRVHDAKGALDRFQMATTALEEGYRFDDAAAAKLIALLREAVERLGAEAAALDAALAP